MTTHSDLAHSYFEARGPQILYSNLKFVNSLKYIPSILRLRVQLGVSDQIGHIAATVNVKTFCK